MNSAPQVGQWYTQLDTRETFLVTGYDDASRTIETQTVDGDLNEIDEEIWNTLPLAFAEPPEDWTEVIDDANVPTTDGSIAPIEKILPP